MVNTVSGWQGGKNHVAENSIRIGIVYLALSPPIAITVALVKAERFKSRRDMASREKSSERLTRDGSDKLTSISIGLLKGAQESK